MTDARLFRLLWLSVAPLRTRQAGRRTFVSVHVLVPHAWTVQRGHDEVERVETALHEALPHATLFTHLEPLEDPRSYDDTQLDRRPAATPQSGRAAP